MNNHITKTQTRKLEKLSKIKRTQISMQSLYSFDDALFSRISECSKYVIFEKSEHIETNEVLQRVAYARTCQLRFCSLCNYYRARNLTPQIVRELRKLAHEGKHLIFLTLTVKNCKYEDLRETIQHMNQSFKRMIRNTKFKNNLHAWIRTLEITFKKRNGLAHPHFHCILAVNSDYFKSKNYFKKHEFKQLWMRSCKSDVELTTHIQEVKKNKTKSNLSSIESAVFELSKYITKASDLANLEVSDMKIIHQQLSKLRFIVTSRNIKLDEKNGDQKIDDEMLRLIDAIVFKFSYESKNYEYLKTVSM